MIFIGVDPGISGAIAFLRPDGALVCDLPTVATTGGAIGRRLHAPGLYSLVLAHAQGDQVRAVMEDISAGGMGRGNAMSVGSQYDTRGTIRATLELAGLAVEMVNVQRWKKLYGLKGKKDDPQAVTKALEVARMFYPSLEAELSRKKDHNKAEAVLIAHWARTVLS